jgi:hypothetical protein
MFLGGRIVTSCAHLDDTSWAVNSRRMHQNFGSFRSRCDSYVHIRVALFAILDNTQLALNIRFDTHLSGEINTLHMLLIGAIRRIRKIRERLSSAIRKRITGVPGHNTTFAT